MAALTRQKRLPKLDKLLRDAAPRTPQTTETVRQNVIAWAAGLGLEIHRRGTA